MPEPEPPPARARAQPLQLLAMRDFRRVWFAGAASSVVRWLDVLAVSVFVLEATGSALMVALTLFVRVVPLLLFGALAGAVAGMVDRRKMLMANFAILGTVYAGLSWLALLGLLKVWQLGFVVFLSGLIWTLEMAIRRTMVAEIGGIHRIASSMGLESSTNNLTRMLGPFLGGFLFELYGMPSTLALGACLYATAALSLMGVDYGPPPRPDARPSVIANLLEGFAFVRASRVVTGTLAVTIVVNLFGFSYLAMVPVIAKQELGLTPFPTGILMSSEGFGAFLGSLLIAFLARPERARQIYVVGSCIYLGCILLFSLSSLFGLSMVALWFGGFGMSGFAAMQSALIIANSPPEMRNRLMGVLAMCIGMGPMGILVVGLLADRLGASTGILITSATGLAAVFVCVLVWPEIRRRAPTP